MNKLTEMICLGVALTMTMICAAPCNAQEPEFVVVSLQYVPAEDVVQMVMQMAREQAPDMVVDQRLNRVFAQGTPESLQLMKKLIGELDIQQPTPNPPNTVVKVYQLSHANADNVANVLHSLVSKQQAQTTRLSVDHSTNSLIVSGISEDLKIMEELLVRLDQPGQELTTSPSGPVENVVVRVTWLVDSTQLSDQAEILEILRQPVPAHESLVQALSESGAMSNIRSVTSSATSIQITSAEGRPTEFRNTSMRNLKGTLHSIIAEGTVRKKSDDAYELDIDLELVQGPVQITVGSTILLPLDHPVAFSVSDVGDFKSAAVVEILKGN